MTIVHIHKKNKDRLKDTYQGSYNDIINQLLDEVENDLPVYDVDYSTISAIRVNEQTLERLSAYRLTDGESYENIIVRLLLAKGLNNLDTKQ